MIPKLICFLFGHKRYWKKYKQEVRDGWLYDLIPQTICIRCGAKL